MPEMEVEFEVWCGTCGDGLCNQTDVKPPPSGACWSVTVAACENCLERAKEEGHDKGFAKGYDEGLNS